MPRPASEASAVGLSLGHQSAALWPGSQDEDGNMCNACLHSCFFLRHFMCIYLINIWIICTFHIWIICTGHCKRLCERQHHEPSWICKGNQNMFNYMAFGYLHCLPSDTGPTETAPKERSPKAAQVQTAHSCLTQNPQEIWANLLRFKKVDHRNSELSQSNLQSLHVLIGWRWPKVFLGFPMLVS